MKTDSHFRTIYELAPLVPLPVLKAMAGSCCLGGLGLIMVLLRAPPPILPSENARTLLCVLLAVLATGTPLLAWLYGRRQATRVLLSQDETILRVFESTFLGTTQRDIPVNDAKLSHLEAGDAAGEEALLPTRVEVCVRGQPNFLVSFTQGGRPQRERFMQALWQR